METKIQVVAINHIAAAAGIRLIEQCLSSEMQLCEGDGSDVDIGKGIWRI